MTQRIREAKVSTIGVNHVDEHGVSLCQMPVSARVHVKRIGGVQSCDPSNLNSDWTSLVNVKFLLTLDKRNFHTFRGARAFPMKPAISAPKLKPITCKLARDIAPWASSQFTRRATWGPTILVFRTAVTYHGRPANLVQCTKIILYSPRFR